MDFHETFSFYRILVVLKKIYQLTITWWFKLYYD